MYSVKAAAAKMEVSPGTVYQLIAAGRLKCYRIGIGRGRIRIDPAHVEEFLKSTEKGGGATSQPPPPPRPVKLKHLRLP